MDTDRASLSGAARDGADRSQPIEALRECEERFQASFDQAPIGIGRFRFDGRFERVNSRLCEFFGYSSAELLNLTVSELTHPDDLPGTLALLAELMAGARESFGLEKRYLAKSGRVLWAQSTVSLLRDLHGQPQSLIAIVEDISARKATDETLRFQSEMLNRVGQAIIATSLEGTIIYLNRAAELLYGWPKAEAIGQDIMKIVPQETRARAEETMPKLRNAESTSGQYVLQRRDGSTFQAFVSNTALFDADGKQNAVLGVSTDITEQNRIQHELLDSEGRLRALTDRLEKAREEERTRIAREIDDQLGQALTGLHMDITALQRLYAAETAPADGGAETRQRLDGMSSAVDDVISVARRVAAELRPAVLDELGLGAALEWQAREFEARAGIFCNLSLPADEPLVSREQATAIFRIFQEVLTNIARHADASEFSVLLEDEGSGFVLTIHDNGIGIEEGRRTCGLGLLGMHERARTAGLHLQISGALDRGTTVSLHIGSTR